MNDIIKSHISSHQEAFERFQKASNATLIEIAKLVVETVAGGGCIYLCGNGGSAADCSHIACELVGRFRKERRALPAMTFTADPAIFTSLGNDYDYSSVFIRQVEAFVTEKDLLWAISTSGTSENVLKAVDKAKEIGAKVIAFTGKPDSPLQAEANICLCANTQQTSTAQEIHVLAYHIVCGLIEEMI